MASPTPAHNWSDSMGSALTQDPNGKPEVAHLSNNPQEQDEKPKEHHHHHPHLHLMRHSTNLTRTRTWLGLHPNAPIHEEHDQRAHSGLLWSRIRISLREPFSEFFGVFVMILFGDGSVAQVLLSEGTLSAPGGNGFGPYQSISWG